MIDVMETKDKTEEYAKRCQFSFPVLMDSNGKVAASYAPPSVQLALPRDQVPIASNLIIDKGGKIRFYTLLDSANFDAKLVGLAARLETLLAEK